jgi:ketopantoate reductase
VLIALIDQQPARGEHRYACRDARDTEEVDAHCHAPRRDQSGQHRSDQATNAPQAMKRTHDRPGVALFDQRRLRIHGHIQAAIASAKHQQHAHQRACHAAGIFGAAAPARASIPGLMASPDLARAYLALIRESATIAAAYGIAIRDYAGFPVRTYLDQPDSETLATFAATAASMRSTGGSEPYSSMAHDVVSGRALEVDQIFGDLVERAEHVGLAVPRLTLIRDILRGIDPGR